MPERTGHIGNPTSGMLHGLDGLDGNPNVTLITINTTTGAVTTVGVTLQNTDAIAFDLPFGSTASTAVPTLSEMGILRWRSPSTPSGPSPTRAAKSSSPSARPQGRRVSRPARGSGGHRPFSVIRPTKHAVSVATFAVIAPAPVDWRYRPGAVHEGRLGEAVTTSASASGATSWCQSRLEVLALVGRQRRVVQPDLRQ